MSAGTGGLLCKSTMCEQGVYAVRRVDAARWVVLAPEPDPFEPPVRAVAVLAEPCSAGAPMSASRAGA